MTLMYEINDIGRFPTVGKFLVLLQARSWQAYIQRQELRFAWQKDWQPTFEMGVQRNRSTDQTSVCGSEEVL